MSQMDFGFAPGDRGKKGKETQADRLRAMFTLRHPATTLIDRQKLNGKSIGTLNQLINYLTTNATGVIGNLMLGSHASDSALVLPMFVGQKGLTEYETVQQTIDNATDPSKAITITSALIGGPTTPPTHSVNYRGCNIGKSQAFLDKWKEAMGGNVTVTAPKHFHGIFSGPDYGYWEYMVYEFTVNAPKGKPFANIADMKAGFRAAVDDNPAAFSFVDGTVIPDPYWDDVRWLPNRLPKGGFAEVPTTLTDNIDTRTTIGANRGLLIEKIPFKWHVDYTSAGNVPNPGDSVACLTAIKNSFATANPASLFSPPFPVFQRQGYAGVDAFVDGHAWTFGKSSRKNSGTKVFMLTAAGIRYSYTVLAPVTDPAPAPDPKTGKLITNFFPLTTFNKVPVADLPADGLLETDSRYFGTT